MSDPRPMPEGEWREVRRTAALWEVHRERDLQEMEVARQYERYRECLELMAAAQKERDDLDRRWRRACELGDALARAADDLLACPPDSHLSPSGRAERWALVEALRAYGEG